MTCFLLIRHGSTDAVGRRLVGRAAGIPLNEIGAAEARALAAVLAEREIEAVYSSPLERAAATAAAIAAPRGLCVTVLDALTDFDFGSWTGKSFEELALLPEFQRFNALRSSTRPPEGEHAAEVQARMVATLDQLMKRHPTSTVAVVGHADPIKTAIGFFLGVPIDLLGRIELAPGSVSELWLSSDHTALLSLNQRPGSAR